MPYTDILLSVALGLLVFIAIRQEQQGKTIMDIATIVSQIQTAVAGITADYALIPAKDQKILDLQAQVAADETVNADLKAQIAALETSAVTPEQITALQTAADALKALDDSVPPA